MFEQLLDLRSWLLLYRCTDVQMHRRDEMWIIILLLNMCMEMGIKGMGRGTLVCVCMYIHK